MCSSTHAVCLRLKRYTAVGEPFPTACFEATPLFFFAKEAHIWMFDTDTNVYVYFLCSLEPISHQSCDHPHHQQK